MQIKLPEVERYKDEPLLERFFEMAALDLGVVAFSFIFGYFIRSALGVEILNVQDT
jgi:hypothetical protein